MSTPQEYAKLQAERDELARRLNEAMGRNIALRGQLVRYEVALEKIAQHRATCTANADDFEQPCLNAVVNVANDALE